MFKDLV